MAREITNKEVLEAVDVLERMLSDARKIQGGISYMIGNDRHRLQDHQVSEVIEKGAEVLLLNSLMIP